MAPFHFRVCLTMGTTGVPRDPYAYASLRATRGPAPAPPLQLQDSCGGYRPRCVCTALCMHRHSHGQQVNRRGTQINRVAFSVCHATGRYAQCGGQPPHPPSKTRVLRWLQAALCVHRYTSPPPYFAHVPPPRTPRYGGGPQEVRGGNLMPYMLGLVGSPPPPADKKHKKHKKHRQFPPENSNQCVHSEVPTGARQP